MFQCELNIGRYTCSSTLDSSERSLPFGLLVSLVFLLKIKQFYLWYARKEAYVFIAVAKSHS